MSWIDKYYGGIRQNGKKNALTEDISKSMRECFDSGHLFDLTRIDITSTRADMDATIVDMVNNTFYKAPYDRTYFRMKYGDEEILVFALKEESHTILFSITTHGLNAQIFFFQADGSVGIIDVNTKEMHKKRVDVLGTIKGPPFEKDGIRLLSIYLTCLCLIYSRSTEKESIIIDEALNAKRERLGKPKLSDYHIVHLPNLYHYKNDTQELSPEERRHIRAHWRRGHIRHQPTNRGIKKLFIAPMLICGDREFVAKHYEYKRVA